MHSYNFTGKLKELIDHAVAGGSESVDEIMKCLTAKSDLATTRFVDYALSLVSKKEGVERIKYYLFNGSLIQRNYASLFFNRRGDWKCVKRAFELNLIDEIQAFAR